MLGPTVTSFPEDLHRLGEIARQDREEFFHRCPRYRPLQGDIIAVALCQGAALHYVNGSNGIKDLDVWTFYAKRPAAHPISTSSTDHSARFRRSAIRSIP